MPRHAVQGSEVGGRDREIVAEKEAEADRRRVGRGRAARAEGIDERCAIAPARVAELGDRLAEVRARGIIVDELRRVHLLAAVPSGRALEFQPAPNLRDERGLGAIDAEVLAVVVEEESAGEARVEELNLDVFPVLAVKGAIPLEVSVEQPPVGLPADLVVVERVRMRSLGNCELQLSVGTEAMHGAAILIEQTRTEALRECEISQDVL